MTIVVPIGKAKIARSGNDVTLVAWSMGMSYALKAADELAKDGISAEVIDLRTLRPMDIDTIVESVKKTGRIVTVEEGWRQSGVGAEIAAQVVEHAFDWLDAPVLRVTPRTCRCPMPPIWKSSRCRRSRRWSRRRKRFVTGDDMRMLALALCVICVAGLTVPARAVAETGIVLQPQPSVFNPMSVETYRVLQRVSRNAGWASTAYRNYLIGLFEGLLSSEGEAAGDRYGRLFCLPPERGRGSLAETFEWMEIELNNVVAKAQPNAYVARIFVAHLTTSYPCKG